MSLRVSLGSNELKTDPRYRYPRASTGTLGTNTLNPSTDTPSIFLSPEIPVSTDTHYTRKIVTAGKCLQRLQTTLNGHQRLDTQLGP
ncbi:hypothetical protein GQ457_17G013540 [Hibiscus cannabinus]